jgi:hypothetical protein
VAVDALRDRGPVPDLGARGVSRRQMEAAEIVMSEPDFEQIARQLKAFVDDHPQLVEQNVRAMAEQLRQVWNAGRIAALDAVVKGLRSERDTVQLRAIIAEVEFMQKSVNH